MDDVYAGGCGAPARDLGADRALAGDLRDRGGCGALALALLGSRAMAR
ncbi:MAG: hypothetical protein IPK80_25745 [Nannocystis sp.]|nr:hypothetical protein [Nannocystis sp.]